MFFKSKNPEKLQQWYVEKLGLKPDEGGYVYFKWTDLKSPGYTLWAPFPEDTKYFEPSQAESMINFVISNITEYLDEIKAKGVEIDKQGVQETDQGKFAWIIDLEGNKIELWEPSGIEDQK